MSIIAVVGLLVVLGIAYWLVMRALIRMSRDDH